MRECLQYVCGGGCCGGVNCGDGGGGDCGLCLRACVRLGVAAEAVGVIVAVV